MVNHSTDPRRVTHSNNERCFIFSSRMQEQLIHEPCHARTTLPLTMPCASLAGNLAHRAGAGSTTPDTDNLHTHESPHEDNAGKDVQAAKSWVALCFLPASTRHRNVEER